QHQVRELVWSVALVVDLAAVREQLVPVPVAHHILLGRLCGKPPGACLACSSRSTRRRRPRPSAHTVRAATCGIPPDRADSSPQLFGILRSSTISPAETRRGLTS